MELKVISERKNELMGRKEYEVSVSEVKGSTPSRKKILKKMAAELDFDPEKAVLESFETAAGTTSFHFYLKVYKNQASILETAARKLGENIMAKEEEEKEEEEEEKEEEEEEKEEEEEEKEEEEKEEEEIEVHPEEGESEEEQKEEEEESVEGKEEREEQEAEEEPDGAEEEIDYDQVVDNTIKDAKNEIKQMDDPDWEALIEAEEENKNRKTMIGWLQDQTED